MQDETHGLGDGHEIAGHRRMGHRDWPTIRDLLTEDLDHGSLGSHHVPEPDDDEAARRPARKLTDELLADPLRRTHYRGRIDCLVRADEDEGVDACADGGL